MIGQLLTGRYLILEKLGTGGFSETYLARDKYLPRHPLCVVKYLKLPSHSTISPEIAQQLFETEAHLLEQFGQQHTQIPTLFAYCQEQDSIYLVQEYIEGESLSKWLNHRKPFTEKAAIALLLEVLPILEYIHLHQVIHRDITPGNLVRRRDGKVVLIDFGAAHYLSETNQSIDLPPLEIGTPGYMPDEQRLGMPQASSDLYALGILAIHLLTGVDPQQFKQDLIAGELDWQCYLQQSLSPDLVMVLNRMVRSRASDRYQQASDVLADLQKLPTAQCFQPEGSGRWQHTLQQMILPASTLLLAGVIVSQLSGGVIGKWFPGVEQHAKLTLNQFEQKFFPPSSVKLTMMREMPIQPRFDRLLIAPNNRVMVTVGTDHLLRLWSLPKGQRIRTLGEHNSPVTTLAISRNSKFLVSGREDGSLQLWDASSGKLLQTFTGHQKFVTAIAISPDLRLLVSSSKDRTLRQWNLQTGALLKTLKHSSADVTALSYGATSDTLITASRDRQLQVWNLRTGQLERTFSGHANPIVGLQMVNDHTLISFGEDRGLMWDLNREALAQELPEASAHSVMVSKCNRNIITVHNDGSIRIWSPEVGKLSMREAGKLEHPHNVAFSPNHEYLVNWSANQRLRFWRINDGTIR
ncbi:MAG: protein kinase [Leptolyngbyaceae cyanobacterium CSU_1_3]|nr:protein kinase [Leptolyngbyaceae cyanobacterium CSU_1_3]